MKSIFQKFMKMPFSVKAAFLMLIAIWVLVLVAFPVAGFLLSFFVAVVASIIRLLVYFTEGR